MFPDREVFHLLSCFADNIDFKHDRVNLIEGMEIPSNVVRGKFSLKAGFSVERLPHVLKLAKHRDKAVLFSIRGRLPFCLKCQKEGHIRRECLTVKCAKCHNMHEPKGECTKILYAQAINKAAVDPLSWGDEVEQVLDGSSLIDFSSEHAFSNRYNSGKCDVSGSSATTDGSKQELSRNAKDCDFVVNHGARFSEKGGFLRLPDNTTAFKEKLSSRAMPSEGLVVMDALPTHVPDDDCFSSLESEDKGAFTHGERKGRPRNDSGSSSDNITDKVPFNLSGSEPESTKPSKKKKAKTVESLPSMEVGEKSTCNGNNDMEQSLRCTRSGAKKSGQKERSKNGKHS